MTTDEHAEQLFPLSVLALEVPETADELALQLAGDLIIGDELGRRCVPASVARRLIEAEAKRRHDAAEADRRREAKRRERQRQREAKPRPVPRGVHLEVPDGMLPVQVLASSDGAPIHEGETYTRVPTAGDWLFGGDVEGGGVIGPTPSEMRRTAKERAGERKSKKGRAT